MPPVLPHVQWAEHPQRIIWNPTITDHPVDELPDGLQVEVHRLCGPPVEPDVGEILLCFGGRHVGVEDEPATLKNLRCSGDHLVDVLRRCTFCPQEPLVHVQVVQERPRPVLLIGIVDASLLEFGRTLQLGRHLHGCRLVRTARYPPHFSVRVPELDPPLPPLALDLLAGLGVYRGIDFLIDACHYTAPRLSFALSLTVPTRLSAGTFALSVMGSPTVGCSPIGLVADSQRHTTRGVHGLAIA